MAVTSFIPTLWSARLLANLNKNHVATALVNRNYEGEIKQKGDKVKINSIGAVTIGTYSKSTGVGTPESLTTSATTLEINQAKFFNFAVDDIDKVQAAGDLIDAAMARASYGLADASDKYILSTIAAGASAGNVLDPVAMTASNIYATIVAIKVAMDKKNVPTVGRKLVLPPEAEGLLLQDDRFVKYSESANERLENGLVAKACGFDIYVSNNVPATSDATPVYSIVATVPEATTYAEQIVKTEAYRPEGYFSDAVKGLQVYGCAVTNGDAVVVQKATF